MPSDPSHAERLKPGLTGHAEVVVTDALTAPAVGSGTVAVFATPSLAALMEKAAVACVEPLLAPGEASLGVHLDLAHTAPTASGQTASATATLSAVDGRKLRFEITARDDAGAIGTARHTRVVVDVERFTRKLAARTS
jgi:fluoroacetyl-CoA thioesterase